MSEKFVNDWEQPIDRSSIKESQNYNLDDIYEHVHSELSLQQSKRDQIITIYLALCSFLLPFALGETIRSTFLKGVIFLVLGLVGVLFSFITVRYREYKEVYWLCCQTITVLQSFKSDALDKSLIQRAFHYSLYKKGKGYLDENGRLKRGQFVKKNIFSSETLHYVIIVLMASFISGLGVALLCSAWAGIHIAAGIGVGAAAFVYLLSVYFRTCMKIYLVLETSAHKDPTEKNEAFNKIFSKAWFLHFYYDEK